MLCEQLIALIGVQFNLLFLLKKVTHKIHAYHIPPYYEAMKDDLLFWTRKNTNSIGRFFSLQTNFFTLGNPLIALN